MRQTHSDTIKVQSALTFDHYYVKKVQTSYIYKYHHTLIDAGRKRFKGT